jgi:hypothetical protein
MSQLLNFGAPRLGIKRIIIYFFSVLRALFSVAVVLHMYTVSESQIREAEGKTERYMR